MAERATTEWRYEKLTWPEINDAVDLGKVCIVPCGAVEQHGPHLPLDVDLVGHFHAHARIAAVGAFAIAQASQVRQHQSKTARQAARDGLPAIAGLRPAVEHDQDRRVGLPGRTVADRESTALRADLPR